MLSENTRPKLRRMSKYFKVEDQVRWNSEAEYVSERIIKVYTKDFDYNGYTHPDTKNDPQYEIKSDKTEHVAAHKAKTLKKLNEQLAFCKEFMEIRNRFYPPVVIFDIIFFIW